MSVEKCPKCSDILTYSADMVANVQCRDCGRTVPVIEELRRGLAAAKAENARIREELSARHVTSIEKRLTTQYGEIIGKLTAERDAARAACADWQQAFDTLAKDECLEGCTTSIELRPLPNPGQAILDELAKAEAVVGKLQEVETAYEKAEIGSADAWTRCRMLASEAARK